MSDGRRDASGHGKDWTAPLISDDGVPVLSADPVQRARALYALALPRGNARHYYDRMHALHAALGALLAAWDASGAAKREAVKATDGEWLEKVRALVARRRFDSSGPDLVAAILARPLALLDQYALICHDLHADLGDGIETGRRLERGEVVTILSEAVNAYERQALQFHAEDHPEEDFVRYAAQMLASRARKIASRGPSLTLPPTEAQARVVVLEGALRGLVEAFNVPPGAWGETENRALTEARAALGGA